MAASTAVVDKPEQLGSQTLSLSPNVLSRSVIHEVGWSQAWWSFGAAALSEHRSERACAGGALG
jgi:hypothetical protein